MKPGTKYVGMDVHQEATAVTVRNANGRVLARGIVPTEEESLLEYFTAMRGSVRVGFEEGTQAQWLYDLLRPVVDDVVVCDRRGKRQRGNEGDRVDADKISELLRRGGLRPVFHGSAHMADLREMVRAYVNVVADCTRTMQRLKALCRARGIRTPGAGLYDPEARAEWLGRLHQRGARLRASVLKELRTKTRAAVVAEARRDPAWDVLRSIPFLGPVRSAVLLGTLRTPWRFRTKRNLWSHAGLAVVTHTSSEFIMVGGHPVRRKRPPLTRGLNRNHNRVVKNVFRSAAVAASGRPGPWRDFYQGMLARRIDPRLAQITLARKIAAVTLRIWKNGEAFDSTRLSAPT
jgi:transposase